MKALKRLRLAYVILFCRALFVVGRRQHQTWELIGVYSRGREASKACVDSDCFAIPIQLDVEVPADAETIWLGRAAR